ncbi:hypothetical protein HDF15_001017 [Granulicella mallensis]|uniref:Uncharacterized protein n=1 Tax=Granulicella mallensis TaxID=940614 RepID=A0A7W8E8D0_9BACT|nr:hypothetical protein [Granulicella mallensis]
MGRYLSWCSGRRYSQMQGCEELQLSQVHPTVLPAESYTGQPYWVCWAIALVAPVKRSPVHSSIEAPNNGRLIFLILVLLIKIGIVDIQ